jgi:hypothetical protein
LYDRHVSQCNVSICLLKIEVNTFESFLYNKRPLLLAGKVGERGCEDFLVLTSRG